MNIKKLITVGLAVTVAMLQWVANAEIKVSDVEVFSGYPWKEVVIGYTITGTSSEPRALALEVTDKDTGKKYEGVFASLSLAHGLDVSEGRHVSKWLICTDNNSFKSKNAVFTLRIVSSRNLYCVIDLAGGKDAVQYPVWYFYRDDMESWVEVYKTTRIALRRVPPCVFKMQGAKNVTLTKNYFIGVFEITQKQYELVTGEKAQNGMRPAARTDVSSSLNPKSVWDAFRGGDWPNGNRLPASNSFVGKLRLKTGLNFDLPTEAQWECACRAGTTTKWSFGDSSDKSQVKAHMWYYGNCFDYPFEPYPHDVGTRLPNPWGLYDMHGNAWEFCLDYIGSVNGGTDPEGPSSPSGSAVYAERVLRGGGYGKTADECSSSSRSDRPLTCNIYTEYIDALGFRIARTVQASEL